MWNPLRPWLENEKLRRRCRDLQAYVEGLQEKRAEWTGEISRLRHVVASTQAQVDKGLRRCPKCGQLKGPKLHVCPRLSRP